MPTTLFKPKILAGQSLSNAVDCSGGDLMYMVMPANWHSANISFQASPDNSVFGDIHESNGMEVMYPCLAGTCVQFSPGLTAVKGSWIKIRSGSRDHPVVQDADCEFIIVVGS